MPLPININYLINRKVESNRLECKAGWNPDKIYHTICAFATDLDNEGGGYIIIGAEEDNGIIKRPVKGLDDHTIDTIQRQMVGFDAKIKPAYRYITSVEQIDGKNILVLWVPTGANRPYSVPESVVAKNSQPKFYIRSKASTIEAKGDTLNEVHLLANRVPFDERGNENITLNDISALRLYDHLRSVNSKLADDFSPAALADILDKMNLLVGPPEHRLIKNVAAMMFCDTPEKFFPYTQVDIVQFPEGRVENPDLMVEVPKIVGPIPKIINETLSYLRTNVIKQHIIKPANSEKSEKAFNYPYQALEEAVVNALYHRDYQEPEPVEIAIEPTGIDILSYSGPDRSISEDAIKEARILKARRYRNRRLGDFLKELGLTEGRATGIPTIQKHLRLNGSPAATIQTDEDRSYFLITIPCREDMIRIEDIDTPDSDDILSTTLFSVLKSPDLQVYIADNVSVIALKNQLQNLFLQVYLQVWDKAKVKREKLIEAVVTTFGSLYRRKELSVGELAACTQVGTLYQFRRNILDPIIANGYVEMTIPDKPKSSKQTYRLTSKGIDLWTDKLPAATEQSETDTTTTEHIATKHVKENGNS